jgi:hypothetical protein
MKNIVAGTRVLLVSLCIISSAYAGDLKNDLASTLFGAKEPVFLTVNDSQGRPRVLLSTNQAPNRFGQPISSSTIGPLFTNALSREILTESSIVPVPSGSAGFVYTYNSSLNIFERQSIGLGAIFNERVNTVGKGILALGVAYIRQEFDEFNGKDLSHLQIKQGLFAKQQTLGDFLSPGIVSASADLDITNSTVALYGIYGITDWLDVSLLLPITEISMNIKTTLEQGSLTFLTDVPVFVASPTCDVSSGKKKGNCRVSDFTIVRKGTPFSLNIDTQKNPGGKVITRFDESRTGVGDLIIRGKARLLEKSWGSVGFLTEFTAPTGEEDDFLGDGAFKARFLMLYSKSFWDNRVNFHVNGGGKITTQTSDKNTAEYGTSLDVVVTPRLSLVGELIGSHRIDSGGLPDNFIDGAFGFKANPFGGLIVNASFRIPATDDGLRSDLAYLVGLEYNF